MYRCVIIVIILFLNLSPFIWAQVKISQVDTKSSESKPVLSNPESSLIDNSISEEPDLFLEGPGEIFDPRLSELPLNSQKQIKYPDIIQFEQTYHLQYSFVESEMGDFFIPGYVEDQEDHILDNKYSGTLKFNTSENTYHFYDYSIYLNQQKNDDNYDESFGYMFQEAYINNSGDRYNWRSGFQMIKLGKVDFDSVINVLNKNNNSDLELYKSESIKQPVAVTSFKWFDTSDALIIHFSPLRNESVGEIFTRNRDNLDKVSKEKKRDDKRVLTAHGGIQYQYNFDDLDIRFGLFNWADPDNKIYFKYTKEDVDALAAAAAGSSLPYNYVEEETSFNFASLEIDATFWDLVLKMDVGVYQSKNVYHLKSLNGTTEMNSFTAPYKAISTSLEKQWTSFFLMGVISYRRIDDVPEESRILYLDGKDEPESYLHRYQLSILTKYDFNDEISTSLAIFDTRPKAEYESASTDLIMIGEQIVSSQQSGYVVGLIYDDNAVKCHLLVVNVINQVKVNSEISHSQTTLGISFNF